MSTLLQENLAKELIENEKKSKPETATALIENAGYTKVTAIGNQKRTLQQKGVHEALKKFGFSIELADNEVIKILKTSRKEENRLRSADLVYKRLGGYAPEKHVNVDISLNQLSDEELAEIAYKEADKPLNDALQGPTSPSNS